MGWFSSSNEVTGPSSNASTYPTTANPSSTFTGSGAEQDRYGAHLGGIGEKAGTKIREVASDLRGKAGAEQDRYGAHLGDIGNKAEDIGNKAAYKAREAANKAGDIGNKAAYKTKEAASDLKGTAGAEQDRYASHFSLDTFSVKGMAQNIFGSGHLSHPAMGYDGQQRMIRLAATKGTGSEQVRD